MNRLIGVIVGAVLLLLVGYFMGSRPVGGLKAELEATREQHTAEMEQVKAEANKTLGEGYLWQARAQLLVAVQDVRANNFGTAANRVAKAGKHLQEAHALPEQPIDLGAVESQITGALKALKGLDPGAEQMLLKAASDLGLLLEHEQA